MVAAGKNPDDEKRNASAKARAAYNHAAYLTERRKMMQAWGDFVQKTLDS